jgi:hypothetical protein
MTDVCPLWAEGLDQVGKLGGLAILREALYEKTER